MGCVPHDFTAQRHIIGNVKTPFKFSHGCVAIELEKKLVLQPKDGQPLVSKG